MPQVLEGATPTVPARRRRDAPALQAGPEEQAHRQASVLAAQTAVGLGTAEADGPVLMQLEELVEDTFLLL